MKKNLVTRTISGLLFVAIMLFCIKMSGVYFDVLSLVLVVLGLKEFYTLMNRIEGVEVNIPFSTVSGTLMYVVLSLGLITSVSYLSIAFIMISLIMMAELFGGRNKPIENIAVQILGMAYISLPFAILTRVESIPTLGWRLVMAFFIIIWVSDTGAYVVGVLLGKHKMFERISPKKTWEGFAGGFLSCMVLALIFFYTNFAAYTLLSWIVVCISIFISGVLGDLVESMMKRSLGVKDSGNFMPGHGGLLDRFDSALIAAPVLGFIAAMLL